MESGSEKKLIGKRYLIERELGRGGMGIVYLATDRLTQTQVALKMVTVPPEKLSFATLSVASAESNLALAKEFQLLASLRHPNIISVLDYGFENGEPYFTMELLNNPQPLLDAAWKEPEAVRVRYLVELLQALTYIHRRGVIHRDLKPGNVLVADGKVKLLDFGLAILSEEAAQISGEQVSGTIPYMAPEILMGQPPSEASDLYAVGIITYEKFAQKHPFNKTNVRMLINDILKAAPDLEPLNQVVLSTSSARTISEIVKNLLEKYPTNRPQNAQQVIAALSEAAGTPPPEETLAIRNSFLEAANFIGREAEFKQLTHALQEMLQGKGSAWLVGGESGVGKTRLFQELRSVALVNTALVLRGQGSQPISSGYQAWRSIVRFLALLTGLSDEEASVLKDIVPDIAVLLEREIPDALRLDEAGTQLRLFNTLAAILTRIDDPLLVIIEDAQWLSSESVALLNHLSPLVADKKLMLAANYRIEEAPALPSALPTMQPITLTRLAGEDIAKLTSSMLGAAGSLGDVVDLLTRETEGNVFFLVEMVRALAEEAGYIDKIGSAQLPVKMFPGGVKAVVERRLQRVPAYAVPLLNHAAIGGRVIDRIVLQQIDTAIDFEKWLLDVSNAGIFTVQEHTWLFSHDKIREGIIEGLSQAERKILHQTLAEAMEVAYQGAPETAAVLAYHWNIVGNEAKEMQYAQIAGGVAAKNNGHVEAITYYKRALELLLKQPMSPEKIGAELLLQLSLGGSLISTRGFASEEVERAFNRAHEIAQMIGTSDQLLPVLWGLATYYNVKADYGSSLKAAQQIRAIADQSQDAGLLRSAIIQETCTHFWQGNFYEGRNDFENFFLNADRTKDIIFQTPSNQDAEIVARCYHAWILWLLGYPDQSLAHMQTILDMCKALQSTHSTAYGWGFVAWLHQYRRDNAPMDSLADQSIALSQQYQLYYWLSAAMILKGYSLTTQNLFEAGLGLMEQGLGIWQMTGAQVFKASYYAARAEAFLRAGELDKAQESIHIALEAIAATHECINEPEVHRLLGEILLGKGQPEEAEREFQQAIAIARAQHSKMFELRAATSLARLWQKQGKKAEAHQQLNDLYQWFTEGFDTPDLVDSRRLLEALA